MGLWHRLVPVAYGAGTVAVAGLAVWGMTLVLALGSGALPGQAAAAAVLPPMDTAAHFRVMPLGDSITRGDGSAAGYGYRQHLANYIKTTGGYANMVTVGSVNSSTGVHEGHPTWTITMLSAQLNGWLAAHTPDLVYVHAGVNDALQGASGQQIADRMAALLAQILAWSPDVRVVVGDLMVPWGTAQFDTASLAVQRYNRLVPGVVAAAGPRVSLARMSRVVAGSLLTDKLHPGESGYERMAWVWWQCTAPLLSADGVTRYGRNPLPDPIPREELCS